MKDFSYITHSHPAYIESLYQDFVQNPESVDPEYRKFFEGFDFALSNGGNGQPVAAPVEGKAVDSSQLAREFSVYQLIQSYRKNGHLVAKTNPIRERKNRGAQLDIRHFGLTDSDLAQTFMAGSFIGLNNASLQQILERLQKVYCGHVGV